MRGKAASPGATVSRGRHMPEMVAVSAASAGRRGLIGQATNAETADFEEASQGGGGADQQAGACGFDLNAVVADQPGNGQRRIRRILRRLDQREGEARFAGAGRPANQYGVRADQDRGGVEGGGV